MEDENGQGTDSGHFILAKIRTKGTKFKLKHKESRKVALSANACK